MGHQHDVDWSQTLDFDSIDTVQTGEERVLILPHVRKVAGRDFAYEEVFLFRGHCFDDESLVLAEEEKAARGSTCLTSFEDTWWVVLWTQRLQKLLWCDAVLSTQLFGLISKVADYFDLLVDSELIAAFLNFFPHVMVDLWVNRQVWVAKELLLMWAFPGFEVADLDAF